MHRSGSVIGRASGKIKGGEKDVNSPSSMLMSRFRSGMGSRKGLSAGYKKGKADGESDGLKSTFGSRKGMGNSRGKGKVDAESDALMRRVKKDNARLLKELEESEGRVKEAAKIADYNEKLKAEIANLRTTVVQKVDVDRVVKAIKEEKVALAVLQMEKDALELNIMNHKRSNGQKNMRSPR